MPSLFASNLINPVHCLQHMSDENLVTDAKLGSEDAFTELWSRHGGRARNLIWRIIRNREDAEDILQEAYLKTFLHLVTFKGESQFSTWLNRIAMNTALMLLRKRRNHPEVCIESSDSDPSSPVIEFSDRSEGIETWLLHCERIQQLRRAIQQLPSHFRLIVELRNRDELPLEEIARRTGISVAAIKSRLSRARAALRQSTSQELRRHRSRRLLKRPNENGYGDHFDEAKLKALPPGSFYTEPPGQTHFAEAGDEPVVVQITGFGPSSADYVDRTSDPRSSKGPN
jgi:RNA polymerase sigma factor (sigma-70 family)